MYASGRDFVCIALLSPVALGLGFFLIFYYKKLINLFLKIKKKFFFLINLFLIFFLIFYYNTFILFYFIRFLSFFLFFLPFILSRVDERLFVPQPGIRAVPLRWESQLQDTGPQETSQLHVIPNGKNLSEISVSTSRPSFTQQSESYSAGHPMPNN